MFIPINPIHAVAQITTIPNNESCISENYDSDNNKIITRDIGITRAREMGYDNALFVMRYLLDEFDNTKLEDDRTEIATKMFKFLNANPSILLYEPTLRDVVMKKIKNINQLILTKDEKYNKAEYSKAIKMMKLSMLINVNNTKMRTDIYNHLNEISYILNDYSNWSHHNILKNEMAILSEKLQIIK